MNALARTWILYKNLILETRVTWEDHVRQAAARSVHPFRMALLAVGAAIGTVGMWVLLTVAFCIDVAMLTAKALLQVL